MKFFVAALLSVSIIGGSTCIGASAAVSPAVIPASAVVQSEAPTMNSDVQIEPRVEETCWYQRIHNGKVQIRQWSITNGCWLTDWIDVGDAA